MSIPESQLETWSHQGAITTSKDTYRSIKAVLESANAPFKSTNFDVFLQGSYGNNTNVWAESDVDIVIRLDACMRSDKTRLSDREKAAYDAAYSSASYTQEEFRSDVVRWLSSNYSNVDGSGKAIYIPGSGNRRNADVLVAGQRRRYYSFNSTDDQTYSKGVYFYDSSGELIENFPKIHSKNLTSKHQDTGNRLKPTIRAVKNFRNWLAANHLIQKETAPSYFLEGLLWNAPRSVFHASIQDTLSDFYNWIIAADESELTTPSQLHWLIRNGRKTSWPEHDFNEFIEAFREGWNNWR